MTKRTLQLHVMISAAEKRMLDKLSKHMGLTRSALMRQVLRERKEAVLTRRLLDKPRRRR